MLVAIMKALILYLALTFLCSFCVLGQSKSVQLAAKADWKFFFPAFKTAVLSRDREALAKLLPNKISCRQWQFHDGYDEGKCSPILLFKSWDKNKSWAWLNLKKLLEKGTLTETGTAVDDREDSIPSNWIQLRITECDAFTVNLTYEKGKWIFSSFEFGNQCP